MTAFVDGRAGSGRIVIRPTAGGVGLRVNGVLDDTASRALLDAVDAALEDGDAVLVEVDVADGLTRETIRNLAACASRGARVRFTRRGRDSRGGRTPDRQ
jgi:ribosomal protein S5